MSSGRRRSRDTTLLYKSSGVQQDVVSLQSSCWKGADEICGLCIKGCFGLALWENHMTGPALHPAGVLSQVTGGLQQHSLSSAAPWHGLSGEQERAWGCESPAGISQSQFAREGQGHLFHHLPKAGTSSESKTNLTRKGHGCLVLRNQTSLEAKGGKWAKPNHTLERRLSVPCRDLNYCKHYNYNNNYNVIISRSEK